MKFQLLGQSPKLLFLYAFFFILISTSTAHAANIDATTSIPGSVIFESSPVTFADGEHAYGFVRLDKGFIANGLLNLNLLFPVAGVININASGGQIILDGDLTLASNVTFPNGGIINGRNYTIFLQGDLTIPANMTLKISGNLTIDSQGHNIIFSDKSVLLIDGTAGTKLTLNNTKLKGLKNNPISGAPSIQFGTAINQKLILKDSDLLLSGFFTFQGGALDIVNTVNLKGDLIVFEYASTYNCTIKKNSRFFMDVSSAFSYRPTDFNQNHIVMEDLTSQLYLNGCIIYTWGNTGLKLIKGHLLVDHFVSCVNLHPTTKDYGLILGDNNPNHDLEIDIFPGASIDVTQGFVTYKNVLI